MMPVWPHKVLPPAEIRANPVPFTRSGGRSIGGLDPATKTDRGYWSVELNDVALINTAKRRTWSAIRTILNGRSGVIAVPVWSFDTAPYAEGDEFGDVLVTHSDGSTFSDGSRYRQRKIIVEMADAVAIGASSVRLKLIYGAADLAGVRFSFEFAAYETGPATLIEGAFWTVPIFPACRAAIPAGAELEFDMPMVLCRLEDDRGMDQGLDYNNYGTSSVKFVEATDQWVPA